MRFFLFILANAMLFIRPSELVPELGELELYRYVIFGCLVVSVPVVLQQLFTRTAGVPPIAGCVLGLFPAALLSHLSNGNGADALEQGIEYLKVLVYFLLLIGLVTTTTRLRQFLFWMGMFSAALAIIAVLRYHADVTGPPPPAPDAPVQVEGKKKGGMRGTFVKDMERDPETGQLVEVPRMCGTGIFNDPNDLALVLITAIPLCGYWLTDSARKAMRPMWVALILVFGYALLLTNSRGGFLALLAGLGSFLYMRFGAARTILLGALVLPLMLAVFAGRMTTISASEGTGQSRIQLWCDGLMFFQQAPLFGIGMEEYHNVAEHVAHNSYIHCYAELGVFGGTLFIGAFYFALYGMFRMKSPPAAAPGASAKDDGYNDPGAVEDRSGDDAELKRLHPYLMAMLVAYAAGIFFLSRSYIVPTYLLLGLAVVYLRLRSTGTTPAWCKLAFARLAGVSVCFLIGAYTFVRLFVNWH
jgi:hypothetical protein